MASSVCSTAFIDTLQTDAAADHLKSGQSFFPFGCNAVKQETTIAL
jgi:hypothetical protein